jgi:hypothetical protein
MARSLGQTVALQRLTIDQDAIAPVPQARRDALMPQEYEQIEEQRPVRNHRQFMHGQERNRRVQSKYERQTVPTKRRQPQENNISEPSEWLPEGFALTERPYTGKAREGRRTAEKRTGFGKTAGKHKGQAFATTEPQSRPPHRKTGAAPAGRVRRASSVKRPASR